jgi:leucyl-tRNA synthetase
MSKARGNVVNPDDVVNLYGADAFRLYEMFLGPLEMMKPWNTHSVEGVYRFLGRVWRLFVDETSEVAFDQAQTAQGGEDPALLNHIRLKADLQAVDPSPAQSKALHACIKKVTDDLDGMRFNTAISALMMFVNEAMTWETKPRSLLCTFLVLLQPFAPHLAEELYQRLQQDTSPKAAGLAYEPWPDFDPALLVETTLELPVQVNGKVRDHITVPADAGREVVEAAALASAKVQAQLAGKNIKKIVVVPNKLVNIAAA